MCGDYCSMNKRTCLDKYSMPLLKKIFDALCTLYNFKPSKTGKAATAAAIVNHLMVPRADVVTK